MADNHHRRATVGDVEKTTTNGRHGRRALLPWIGLGVATIVVAGAFSWRTSAGEQWLGQVTTEDNVGGLHTVTPLNYKARPPMGGPHHPTWQNCGIFDEPVGDAHAVHSLEHGAVWVTYKPDEISTEDLGVLEEIAGRNDYVILSPYPEQEAPVTLTAWNHQLKLEDASDARVLKFVTHFAKALTSPEPGAPCDGGKDTTRETAPEESGPVMGAGVDAANLLGMTEAEAQEYANNQGWTLRVGSRDGEAYMLTTDYLADRVTITLENGKVTDAVAG